MSPRYQIDAGRPDTRLIDSFPRPEQRVLLWCAHAGSEAEKRPFLKNLLAAELDWDYLLSQGSDHALLCLLWRSLKGTENQVPGRVLDRLREYHRFSLFRSIQLTRKLFEILELARRNGVRVLPFKGPPLAVLLYGEMALRPTSDLDLLVSPGDLETLGRALLEAGHQADESNLGSPTTPSRKKLLHWSFFDHDGVRVEVHWAFSQPDLGFRFSLEELWKGSRGVYLAGRQVPFPGPQQLLMVLCVHLAKHRWNGLRWLRDIANAVNREQLDWEGLLVASNGQGAGRMLLPSLILARDLLGARVPDQVPTDDLRSRILAAWARSLLFSDPSLLSGFREHLLAVALRRHFPDKLRYLLRGLGIVDWHLGDSRSGGRLFLRRSLSFVKDYTSRSRPR